MIKTIVLGVMIPFMLNGDLSSLKKDLELMNKKVLISYVSETSCLQDRIYNRGRAEAIFEIIEMIEKMELAQDG